MTWFKVDDNLHSHPKARAAGLEAMGLWSLAGSYCGQYLTNGVVPTWFVDQFPRGQRLAAKLIEVHLWHAVDGGWRFHQWSDRQPSKDEVEAEREATRLRVAAYREKKRNAVTSGVTPPVTDAVSNGDSTPAPTRPDPARPVVPTELPLVETSPEPSAATLVAEWIDHCGTRPPARVIGQVAKELSAMLSEGIPYEDVRHGLASWQNKGLHPSALASEVHTIRSPRSTVSRRQQNTDDLFARMAARAEQIESDRKAIGQ